MKKLLIGIGITQYNNGEENMMKIWVICGNTKRLKKIIGTKMKNEAKGKFKPKFNLYIISGPADKYCSILEIKKGNKMFFGIGFDKDQMGAYIKAEIILTEKVNKGCTSGQGASRPDVGIMLKNGKIIHENEIDAMLRE